MTTGSNLKHLTKSIIITGASASGKTTLCRRFMVHFDLLPLPVHMTRSLRYGEVENVDAISVSEKEFKSRFSNNEYLQESLDASYFSGAYYGCPRKWVSCTVEGDYRCFVCPTVMMAKTLKASLGESIFWIHLIVSDRNVRAERMMKRDQNVKMDDFKMRMEKGDSVVDTTGHDLIIDTGNLNAWEIFFQALVKLQGLCVELR